MRKRWDSHPQEPRDPYLFSRQAPHLAGSLPSEPCVSPARFERATFAFGTRRSAPLSYGELIGVDGRGRTCTLRFRKPAPSPFGHVDMRAVDGTRTRILRRDGPALEPVELRQHVRALGLEPSLVPVKSRVPYPSGVTRVGGSGGNRTPCVETTAALQAAAPHGATGPSRNRVAATPMTMPMQLSRCWCPGLAGPARAQARKVSNPRPAVLETAAPPWLEPENGAHDELQRDDGQDA